MFEQYRCVGPVLILCGRFEVPVRDAGKKLRDAVVVRVCGMCANKNLYGDFRLLKANANLCYADETSGTSLPALDVETESNKKWDDSIRARTLAFELPEGVDATKKPAVAIALKLEVCPDPVHVQLPLVVGSTAKEKAISCEVTKARADDKGADVEVWLVSANGRKFMIQQSALLDSAGKRIAGNFQTELTSRCSCASGSTKFLRGQNGRKVRGIDAR